jgi:D-alanyl-D-alanine carboxypeptidase
LHGCATCPKGQSGAGRPDPGNSVRILRNGKAHAPILPHPKAKGARIGGGRVDPPSFANEGQKAPLVWSTGLASHTVNSSSRPRFWRFLAVVFLGLFVFAPAIAEAKAVRAYAGIVVDAKSGKVLYESDADATRYPASVSKVMTLYVLFQELSAGRIKLSDKMPVSKWASKASPTKLGLKAGATITVDNAIRAIVTLSANDMARVVAEYIGGSESAFGKRMTATARALGMAHTTYVNASGLPDSRQVTTVRDQAILARAIYEHFPKYYAYFQTKSFSYGKRTYGNHNNLLGKDGIDGIKTGYTGAAGYNLMTAARTNGKHIVVVAFGFNSAGKRDAKVRGLVDKYLPDARSGSYTEVAMIPVPGRKGSAAPADPVQVASAAVMPMPAPTFRADGEEEAPADPQMGIGDVDTVDGTTVASLAPQPLERPVDIGMPPAVDAINQTAPIKRKTLDQVVGTFKQSYRGAPPAPLGETTPSAPLIPPVGIGDGGQPLDLMTSGSIESDVAVAKPIASDTPIQVAEVQPAQEMPAPLKQGWVVQLGAAPSEDGANGLLKDAGKKVRSLGKFDGFVQRFEKDGQTFYRARFGGFSGQSAANDMCKQLKQAKMSCLAMQS